MARATRTASSVARAGSDATVSASGVARVHPGVGGAGLIVTAADSGTPEAASNAAEMGPTGGVPTMAERPPADPPAARPRATAIVAAARTILDAEGRDALTMRRLGEAVGIRAPSLYRHFPDKAAVEAVLLEAGFDEMADAVDAALARDGETLAALGRAYRAFALARPHLYRLMTAGRLPRERLRPGVEVRPAVPLLRVTGGDEHLARAAWAFAHGMVILELDDRFPPGADLDAAWEAGLAAFAVGTVKP